MKSIFENEYFLVVDKRPGFLSVPSRQKEDPRKCELFEWSQSLNQQLWPVHRLDEKVSGLLMFAKTKEAHQIANAWFEKRKIKKTYQALTFEVDSQFTEGQSFVWTSYLLRGKKRAYEKDFGKEAKTKAILSKKQIVWGTLQVSLWELHPLTGRSHQLRFELAKQGYPILGDVLYGSSQELPISQSIALRSTELDFNQCEKFESLGLPQKIFASSLLDWMKEHSPC